VAAITIATCRLTNLGALLGDCGRRLTVAAAPGAASTSFLASAASLEREDVLDCQGGAHCRPLLYFPQSPTASGLKIVQSHRRKFYDRDICSSVTHC